MAFQEQDGEMQQNIGQAEYFQLFFVDRKSLFFSTLLLALSQSPKIQKFFSIFKQILPRLLQLNHGIIIKKYQLKLMSVQLTQQIFQQSTDQYRRGNYQVCTALLNDCIVLEPNISILYSNRALSNFGLKDLENSISDLQTSIRVSHLHYIGYMNLFSLHFLKNDEKVAFKYLCLGLSSSYTILHTLSKEQEMVNLSLHYSYNNKESLFLKAMYLFQQGSLTQSLDYFNQTIKHEPNSQIKQKLQNKKSILQKSLKIPKKIPIQTNSQQINTQPYKLQTDLQYKKQTYYQQIQNMITQFNKINNLINFYKYQIFSKSMGSSKNEEETNYHTESSKIKKYDSQFILNTDSQGQNVFIQDNDQKDEDLFVHSNSNKLRINSVVHQGLGLKKQEEKEEKDDEMEYSFEIEDESVIQKIESYSIIKEGENHKGISIFIEKVSLYTYQDEEINQNLYIILDYQSENKKMEIRTRQSRNNEGLCRWEQWSDKIQTSYQPKMLNYSLYEKISQQQSIKLGGGSFQLQSYGFVNLPIFCSQNGHLGDLQLTIQQNIQ